jgi:hypothetical protein
MKRQRFSEEQIIRILHEAESLDNVCEVCRQHNIKGEHWRVSRETVRGIRKREGLQVIKKERPRRPVAVSTPTPTRAAYPMCVGIVAGSSQKLLRSIAIRPDSVPRTANLNVVYQLRV